MNEMINNIFAHWKTSLTGLLTAVVAISAVLMSHGVTGAKLGTSNVVEIAAACASAVALLLAKDPGAPTQSK